LRNRFGGSEADKALGFSWVRHTLFDLFFDEQHLLGVAQKLLAFLSQNKRSRATFE